MCEFCWEWTIDVFDPREFSASISTARNIRRLNRQMAGVSSFVTTKKNKPTRTGDRIHVSQQIPSEENPCHPTSGE
jgi:hypothetical protein